MKLSNIKLEAMRLRTIMEDFMDRLEEENLLKTLRKEGAINGVEYEKSHQYKTENQLKILKNSKIHLLKFNDKNYPENLRPLEDAPPILYCRGSLKNQDSNAVSIVGTRKANEYGKINARKIAKELSKRGITVVSGLAHGVDTQSHIGAMEAGGRTLAVMGTGIDKVYPPGNRRVADRITETGALLTELPPMSPPLPHHFPARNRIISGLSKAVVAIQAPLKSGVLSTVRWALEYGKDVYALPGDVNSKLSRGINKLLTDGAIPLTDPMQIIEHSNLDVLDSEKVERRISTRLTGEEKKVYESIGIKPKSLDVIVKETGMKVENIIRILALLEMKDLIREVSGKRFIREDS